MRNIPFSPPDITEKEIENVIGVLKSGWITTGPKTKEFERKISEYCGTEKTICLNSATACMEMCLRLLGVGPGDEVITSAYTYTASASVIDHVGAKIVLVDTEENSYHLSQEALKKAITSKTKVIIPVDIAGIMCNYNQIFEIVNEKKNLFNPMNDIQRMFGRVIVLADAAHSFGASYNEQISGNVADFTSFSFHAVKNLTSAEGGALTWQSLGKKIDDYFYTKIHTLSLHGQTKDALSKMQLGSWEYDIVEPGYKCNMTDIQAAIGMIQLERIHELYKTREELLNVYYNEVSNIKFIDLVEHDIDNNKSSKHLLLSQVNCDRNKLIKFLAENGVATNVHYKPLPLLTAYKKMNFNIKDFPNAFKMFKNEVTFPLNTIMTVEDIDYISGLLKNYGEKNV